MAELKTKPNDGRVVEFLEGVEDPTQRGDALRLLALMREITGQEPEMWGGSIVGFGRRRYENASGGGEWFLTGFSPRKGSLTLYITSGFDAHSGLMARLGKHKTGKACLYVKRLADIEFEVLAELIRASATLSEEATR